MSRQARAAGSNSQAHTNLTGASRATREQETRNIGAGNQQHETNSDKQEVEGFREPCTETVETFRRRGKLEVRNFLGLGRGYNVVAGFLREKHIERGAGL